MSERKRAADTEWMAESFAAILDTDPSAEGEGHDRIDRDRSWAGLMGPAGMSFTPADLRIDDATALVVGLFDAAIEEYFETPNTEDDDSDDTDDEELEECELLESDGAQYLLSDDCPPVDDRSLKETQWALLVDSWWRALPPFEPTDH